jgi:hypothetical protein
VATRVATICEDKDLTKEAQSRLIWNDLLCLDAMGAARLTASDEQHQQAG